MEVEIRPAGRDDLQDILDLYSQPEMDAGAVLTREGAEAVFKRIQGYPDYGIYVARVDGETVGTFALLIMDNLGHLGAPSGIVEQVCVAPPWQGRGVGTAMMEFAMAAARRAGCYKLTLSSDLKRKGAHRFYEGLGFSRHGFSFVATL